MATTPSTYVWSVAVDKSGTAYVGTASPATVLRVGPDGKPFTLFETKDLSVQVVRLGPDGALYAATLPSGKVYRLKADATAKQDETSATVVFDAASWTQSHGRSEAAKTATQSRTTSPHYIWDMTFDAAGGSTSPPAGRERSIASIRPSPDAKPEVFFKSDEAAYPLAGLGREGQSDCRHGRLGLVYRISPQGKGYVLFEAPRREITSVAVAANGTIYAASVGDKSRNPLPPLPVQGAGSITITMVQPGSMQAANTSASVPEGSEIYALDEGPGAAQTLGRQGRDCLRAGRAAGRLAGAHRQSRARLPNCRRWQLRRHRAPGGAAGIEPGRRAGRKRRAEACSSARATPASWFCWARQKSTSTPATCWTQARWPALAASRSSPARADYELLTRTGNVEQPVRGERLGMVRLAAAQRRRGGFAGRPLPAMEGSAAREWNAGQRGRELFARQCRAGGG